MGFRRWDGKDQGRAGCRAPAIRSKKRIHAQSCSALGDFMDCSPPGFSVYGISQARIWERVAISSSRGSSVSPVLASSPLGHLGGPSCSLKKVIQTVWKEDSLLLGARPVLLREKGLGTESLAISLTLNAPAFWRPAENDKIDDNFTLSINRWQLFFWAGFFFFFFFELPVKFYLGQNEGCSQRERCWETALRSCSKEAGRGEVSMYVILVKRECMQSSRYFFWKISASLEKLSASHKEQLSPWRILVIF